MPADPGAEVLLDTHALLWWQAGSARLSVPARSALDGARTVLISPVSCWELAMLVDKRRVQLDRPTATWVRDLFAQDGVAVADLTPDIAVGAAELPGFHGDPADRMIYATARSRQSTLITKDATLRHYAEAHGDCRVWW